MGRAGEYGECTAVDRNERVLWVMLCVTAAGTRNTASREMLQEFRAGFGGEPTDGAELGEMVITADNWDRELVDEQERNRVTTRGVECGVTRITPNR